MIWALAIEADHSNSALVFAGTEDRRILNGHRNSTASTAPPRPVDTVAPAATELGQFVEDLLALAASGCSAPVAVLICDGQPRGWQRGEMVTNPFVLAREFDFCAEVSAQSDGLMVVPDAAKHLHLRFHRLVRGEPAIRFLASVPLVTCDGQNVGTLCVVDYAPRELPSEQRSHLARLARLAASQMALRRRSVELERQALHEERFRTLVETAPAGFVLMDVLGTAKYVTTAITQLMGYEMNEVLGRDMFSFVHPEDLAQPFAVFAEVICKPLSSGRSEFRVSHKGGSWKWMEAVAQNFLEEPSIQAIAVNLWNISARKEAEEALRANEARFRSIVESNVVGIFFWDTSGGIHEANERFLQMVGYTRADLEPGRVNWFKLTPPEFAEQDQKALQQLNETGACSPFEKVFIHKDGSHLPVLVGAACEPGTRERGFCLVVDVSDRQRMERELISERNLFRLILDNLPLCVYAVDREKKFILNNRGHHKLLNLPEGADVRQKSFQEVAVTEIADPETADLNTVIATGKPMFDHQRIVTGADRRERVHLSSKVPLLDHEGLTCGVIGISQDITERQHTQEQIQKLAAFPQFNPNPIFELSATGELTYCNAAAQDLTKALGREHPAEILPPSSPEIVRDALRMGQARLRLETRTAGRTISWSFFPIAASRVVHCYAVDNTDRVALEAQLRQSQKMESVGQLAGGVAHDFNNILTVIQGHAALLEQEALTPELAESTQQIAEAADRAANLTRQLLAFSRRQVLQPKNLDLNVVVCSMARMLQRLLGEDIVLNVHYSANLPPVHADPGMIEQVLMNLSVNSRDAMPKGGQLEIMLKAVAFDRSNLTSPQARPGTFVQLTVTDTGTGIPPEILDRIFEPFFTTKDVGRGTGLGLPTVYGIVQQHHGWIELQSEVGRGTVFEIFLPASDQPITARTAQKKKVRGGSECILLVEDEEPLRELVRSVLEAYGYKVVEASSGRRAIDVWKECASSVDLLLTDIVMPDGVTGSDLADALKQEKPGLRVLFSSGYSSDIIGRDFVLSEGVNFLQKPYNPQTLAETVRDCLDR